MHEFMGFNKEDIQQYVELSEAFDKFKRLEKLSGTQIRAFLSVVGEEIQDRFANLTGQNDWQMEIKNYTKTINWGLYLTRPSYQSGAFFGVWLTYFPPEQNDRLLHTSISLETDVRLVDIIRQRIEEFKVRNPIKGEWGESQIGKDFDEFYEDAQLQWNELENWQETKNYLVERTVAWMVEFTPIIEEQVVVGNTID